MPYQPLRWTEELLAALGEDHLDATRLYDLVDKEPSERATVDRLAAILSDLRAASVARASVLDLGCSGGFLSIGLAATLAAHVTAVDDDRYVSLDGESESSTIEGLRERARALGVGRLEVVRAAAETFLEQEAAQGSVYDVVLVMNVLHHLAAGYSRRHLHTRLEDDRFTRLLDNLGAVTGSRLYLESNAEYFERYEEFLVDLKLRGGFETLCYLTHSPASDGSHRIVWRLEKN